MLICPRCKQVYAPENDGRAWTYFCSDPSCKDGVERIKLHSYTPFDMLEAEIAIQRLKKRIGLE